MDTETGRIRPYDEIAILGESERQKYIEMEVPPTPIQRGRRKVSRNDPCPCGSGKKFKKCHWTGAK